MNSDVTLRLQRAVTGLTGADTNGLRQLGDEDFSVADFPGARRLGDGRHGVIKALRVDRDWPGIPDSAPTVRPTCTAA